MVKSIKHYVICSLVLASIVTVIHFIWGSLPGRDVNCHPQVPIGDQERINDWPTISSFSPLPYEFDESSGKKMETIENLYLWSKDKPFPGIEGYIKYTTIQRDLKPLSNIVPVRPDFGPVVNDVTSFKYPLNVPACSDSHQVFIAVISATYNFEKRQMIRNTWKKHLDNTAKLAFIVGQHTSNTTIQHLMEKESATHGDILQVGMVDTYHNLSIKVNGLLNWIHGQCPRVPFVYKCDDDIYVNVRNLATVLRHLPRHELTMYGSTAIGGFYVFRGEQGQLESLILY